MQTLDEDYNEYFEQWKTTVHVIAKDRWLKIVAWRDPEDNEAPNDKDNEKMRSRSTIADIQIDDIQIADIQIAELIYIACVRILNVGWIFQVKRVYLFESLIWLNSANCPGKSIVLSTKEAPKPAGLGGFWEGKLIQTLITCLALPFC